MNFVTGLETRKLFDSLFWLIESYTKYAVYWRRIKRIASTKIKGSPKFTGAKKNKKFLRMNFY